MPSFSAASKLSDIELEKMDINDIQNVMMKYDQAMMENEQRGRSADEYTQMRYGYGSALAQAQKQNRALAQMKQHIWVRWYRLQRKKMDQERVSDAYPDSGDSGDRGEPDYRGGD